MITILWGKTAGSIFMAGCIDNIRKESNMTPKQWYDLGDAVVHVRQLSETFKSFKLFIRTETELDSGRKDSLRWEKTGR